MISVGRWVMSKSCMIFCAFCHGPEGNLLFFWCQKPTSCAFRMGRISFCKSTWTLISVVPLENLMFGFGPVSPLQVSPTKVVFPSFYPLQKGEKETRCLCRCFTNQFFMDAFRDFPVFLGPAGRFWRLFFWGFATLKKPWLRKNRTSNQGDGDMQIWCRYQTSCDLGIVGRDSSFFCITKWHLVQVQKSKKCRKVQPQIKVHAHDRQKRDVQNLHIS